VAGGLPKRARGNDLRHDDVTRDGFVLLTRVTLSVAQRTLLAGRRTDVLVVEPSSALHQWLTDGKAAAALVRSDFTVLRLARDGGAPCDAAPRFLPRKGPRVRVDARPRFIASRAGCGGPRVPSR
jgi:3-(3-hydroxy-phenyl)propionate hydroxylase